MRTMCAMKKTFLLWTLLLLLMVGVFLPNIAVQAADAGNTESFLYDAVIYDDADLLTDEEEQKLLQDMQKLRPYGNVIFSSVVLSGGNYEKYAQDMYYDLYGNEPGALFQIDMGNRKLTLSTSTDLDKLVSHERDSIIDNIYKKASDGDYYGCAAECFDQIWRVVNDLAIAHQMKYIDNAIVALILGLLINFAVIFAVVSHKGSKSKLLGEMMVASAVTSVAVNKGQVTKRYDPQPKSSSGGGGGSSGGGGGGGGFSGGSSSHGF